MAPIRAQLEEALARRPVVYVTRDIERALGSLPLPAGLFIVANDTPYAREIYRAHPDQVLLIHIRNSKGEMLDTYELLCLPEVKECLTAKDGKIPQLLVFKNNARIERLAAKENWPLLNPSATLAEKAESKISQLAWLGPLASLLPPRTAAMKCGDVRWCGEVFILQFAHGHTGEGTILITNEAVLQSVQATFAEREVRTSSFVQGPVFTSNICVTTDSKVLWKNISYQITGIAPYTDLNFATIGNDWSYARKIFFADTEDARKKLARYSKIVESIGNKLATEGWKGLFGVDIIMNEKTGELFLLEINARQPASTTFESQLQEKVRSHRQEAEQEGMLTTFETHLASLLGLVPASTWKIETVPTGAQIIQRVTAGVISGTTPTDPEPLRSKGFTVIEYPNNKLHSDLLRIQTDNGIVESHGVLKPLM